MSQRSYSPIEYERISRLAKWWHILHMIIGILFFVSIAFCLMFVFQRVNAEVYAHLGFGAKWFPQSIAPFSIPALFIAFPLGVLLGLKSISFFNPTDSKEIIDLLNVRLKYDSIPAWTSSIKFFGTFCIIALTIVSWCFVSVSPDGINIKNAFSFTTKHYDYSDIKTIKHHQYHISQNDTVFNDHLMLYFKDGISFSQIVPEIDYNESIKYIAKQGTIPIVEEPVGEY